MISKEMPKYKSHKTVWALQIGVIEYEEYYMGDVLAHNLNGEHGATIIPAETAYSPFKITREYIQKHSPQEGGYFVVYKDGYLSYSPKEVFENGYTSIEV